ncbi:MAG TPA: hypothetical protein VNS34_23815 [Rhizobiaceae bacterium]|nr:hypothetical protein [Rhizobiaceae bacterium]
MSKQLAIASALLLMALPLSPAAADESGFLRDLAGNWQGSGQVRLNPGSKPMKVSCTLDSQASGTTINMDGACRALAVFSRKIGADLKANGPRYTGSYVGSRRGTARLSGTRSGRTLNLQVKWPGTREASMQVASLGSDRMRLVTREPHPQTGQQVVTAEIDFNRK